VYLWLRLSSASRVELLTLLRRIDFTICEKTSGEASSGLLKTDADPAQPVLNALGVQCPGFDAIPSEAL
jgi:hypothetical protein